MKPQTAPPMFMVNGVPPIVSDGGAPSLLQ